MQDRCTYANTIQTILEVTPGIVSSEGACRTTPPSNSPVRGVREHQASRAPSSSRHHSRSGGIKVRAGSSRVSGRGGRRVAVGDGRGQWLQRVDFWVVQPLIGHIRSEERAAGPARRVGWQTERRAVSSYALIPDTASEAPPSGASWRMADFLPPLSLACTLRSVDLGQPWPQPSHHWPSAFLSRKFGKIMNVIRVVLLCVQFLAHRLVVPVCIVRSCYTVLGFIESAEVVCSTVLVHADKNLWSTLASTTGRQLAPLEPMPVQVGYLGCR